MVRNVNNEKSEKLLSPNGLSQVGGGGCKKNKLTIGVCAIAVLLSFAAPALADTPTPTLDAIKATQSAYLTGTHPSYTLTEIIEDAHPDRNY